MTKDTGGQAFPIQHENGFVEKGMSLRDYHIAHAPDVPKSVWEGGRENQRTYLQIIRNWRCNYADAMLSERKKHD